jgi:hypothetical protein
VEEHGTESARVRSLVGIVSPWKVTGQRLELFDASGTFVARFEAVYMR